MANMDTHHRIKPIALILAITPNNRPNGTKLTTTIIPQPCRPVVANQNYQTVRFTSNVADVAHPASLCTDSSTL